MAATTKATTTKAPAVITAASLARAADTARERIRKEFENSIWADCTDMICKLHLRYMKEELKSDAE